MHALKLCCTYYACYPCMRGMMAARKKLLTVAAGPSSAVRFVTMPGCFAVHAAGGGCGFGAGLGWGWGAAWGSKYIIVDAEFESKEGSTKPHWLAQLQQQFRIQKYEKSHQQ